MTTRSSSSSSRQARKPLTDTASFSVSDLAFRDPVSISNTLYFIEMKHVDDAPVYIQTPRCKTKTGFVKTQKKMYVDLMIASDKEENAYLFQILDQLEDHVQEVIYERRADWFEHALEKYDIENSFTPLLRSYRPPPPRSSSSSAQRSSSSSSSDAHGEQQQQQQQQQRERACTSWNTQVLRATIPTHLGNKCALSIFDEMEKNVSYESIKGEETDVVCVLQVNGIKCLNRTFVIDVEVKQVLVVAPTDTFFQRCVIQAERAPSIPPPPPPPSSSSSSSSSSSHSTGTGTDELPHDLEQQQQQQQQQQEQEEEERKRLAGEEEEREEEERKRLAGEEEEREEEEERKRLAGEEEEREEEEERKRLVSEKVEADDDDGEVEQMKKKKDDGGEVEHMKVLDEGGWMMDDDDNDAAATFGLHEVDATRFVFAGDDAPPIRLNSKRNAYLGMYAEAKRKAKKARDAALMAYLDLKRIKNVYRIKDASREDSDSDIEEFLFEQEQEKRM